MRTLVIVALLILAAALTAGCATDSRPVEVSRGDNGCVVYRVNPGFFENYVYYTVCGRGENIRTSWTTSNGKGQTRTHAVETVWQ